MNLAKFITRLAFAGSLGLALVASSSPVSASAADANREALARLGGCISGGGEGDMLLLIDRSASLQRTDPENQRVEAAKYVVRQMSSVSKIYGWKMNVAIAGFDTHYQRKLDWQALGDQSLAEIESTIEGFRDANHGEDTDYWQAVDHARRDLAKRAGGEVERCPFVVWFTDGEFSIEPRQGGLDMSVASNRLPYDDRNDLSSPEKAAAGMAAGKRDLCRDGGVADQTRNQGIITLAVGLNGGGNPDFSLLKGIATGKGTTCGAITSPSPGAFFTADGIDGLYQAFDQIASPGQDPVVQESDTCASNAVCPAGTHRFVMDASIGSVHGLATTGAAGQKVVITGPNGKRVEFLPSSGKLQKTLSGANLTGDWLSDRSVSFDLKRSGDEGWVGEWGIAFVSPKSASGRAKSSLHLYGDLLPSATDAAQLTFRTGGESPAIKLGLARADGSPVDPATVTSDVVLGASIIQADQTVPLASQVSKSGLGVPIKADLTGLKPGSAVLRVTLDVTTTPWTSGGKTVPGTKLEAQARDYQIQLLPPGNYPVVQDRIDFGSTDKAGQVAAVLKLTGAGCAWLAEPTKVATSPEGIGDITIGSTAKSRESCSAGEVPLTLDVGQVGNGLVSGTITVESLPQDKSGEPVPATVAFGLDMQRPPDLPTLLWVLIAGTLLGVAVPVGLLYLLKYLTAVIPGDSVATASIRGQVTETISFVAAGVPLTAEDLSTSILNGASRRRVALAGGRTLLAKTGLAPTEPGYVVVEQPGLAAGGRTTASSVKGHARLPLAVQGNWCVALDQLNPSQGDVEITVFTAAGGAGLTDLLDDVRSNVGQFVAHLRKSLPDQSSPATSGSEWSTPASSVPAVDQWTTPIAGSSAWTGSAGSEGGNPAGASAVGPTAPAPDAGNDESW